MDAENLPNKRYKSSNEDKPYNYGISDEDFKTNERIIDIRIIKRLIDDPVYRNQFLTERNYKVMIDLTFFYTDPTEDLYGYGPDFPITYAEWNQFVKSINLHDDVLSKLNVFDGVTALAVRSCPIPFDLYFLIFAKIKYVDLSSNDWIVSIGGFTNVKKLFLSYCRNLEGISGVHFDIEEIQLRDCKKIKFVTNFTNFNNFLLDGSNIDLSDFEKMKRMTIPYPVLRAP